MSNVTISPSLIHGLGVFAARGFASGESILAIDDSRVVDEQHPLRDECGECEQYCDYLAGGKIVLLQSPERYLNHSCQPNAYIKTVAGQRHLLSLIPIRAGQEITIDYSLNCHGGESWQCACGNPDCRQVISGSFFELPHQLQTRYLTLLDKWFIEEHSQKVALLRPQAEDPRRP